MRIVSAARCVICSGSGSADSRGAYRHARDRTAIMASTTMGSAVNTTAIYAAVIHTGLINGNSA